jgi:oxygen-independent coproporphyrinogen-3 oxidase
MSQLPDYRQYMYSYPHKSAYRRIDPGTVGAYLRRFSGRNKTLYYHIPFCESKCGYCNLFSIVTESESLNIDNYINAIQRQVRQYCDLIGAHPLEFEKLIFGGGTPLLLTVGQLERLFTLAETAFKLDFQRVSIEMETSPNQTTREKLDYLKARGVQRISIGIQSFVEAELAVLMRRHKADAAHRAAVLIRETGFAAMNMDLIYGIPGQTLDSLAYSINQALIYQPEELFAYPLYVRKSTGIFHKVQPDAGLQSEMYRYLADRLAAEGYTQTSMRRFAKQKETPVKSCGFEEMLALGCGGRSYIGNLHFSEAYGVVANECRQILNSFCQKSDFLEDLRGYLLDWDEQQRRFIIKNLLYYQGIPLAEYRDLFAHFPREDFSLLEMLIQNGWVVEKDQRLSLTAAGLGFSDQIGALFISPRVMEKMEEEQC